MSGPASSSGAPGTPSTASSGGSVPAGEFEIFTPGSVLSAGAHNRNFSKIAPWLKPKMIRGATDFIKVCGKNLIVCIGDAANPGTASPDSKPPVERFQICARPITEGSDTALFDGGDYFWARFTDGSSEFGEPIVIAKPWHMRISRTGVQSYRGITSTFAFARDGTYKDWVRTVHVTNPAATYDDEVQLPDPPYLIGDEILAVDLGDPDSGGTGVTATLHTSSVLTVWQELSPMRNWTSVGVDPPP